ncbi:MAG: class I SAM-dependent methyltransferase, partial [Thermodesulfobacteriota bacterium]
VQQHREKLKYQTELVKSVCANFESPTIVSLACGSSRDLEQAQAEIKKAKARVILVDFDEQALKESKQRLSFIQDQLDIFLTDIRKLPKIFKSLNGRSHFIYAGGLFDYLPDGTIRILIRSLSEFVSQGLFLFTNIAKPNPYRGLIETAGNWALIERSEEEMLDFLSLTKGRRELKKDQTGLTWLATSNNQRR